MGPCLSALPCFKTSGSVGGTKTGSRGALFSFSGGGGKRREGKNDKVENGKVENGKVETTKSTAAKLGNELKIDQVGMLCGQAAREARRLPAGVDRQAR